MTALRYLPGQVAVYSASPWHDFDESYLSVFGELVESRGYSLDSGDRYLHLLVGNVGEELRFLDRVRSQPNVIAASLNYIGFGLNAKYIDEPGQPELAYRPGLPFQRDLQYFLLRGLESGPALNLPHQQLAAELKGEPPPELIAAIDVSPQHCQEVMTLIAEGYARVNNSIGPTIIGLTANLDNSTMTDLYGFADRILILSGLVGSSRLTAVNMSVDFSQIIRSYHDLEPADFESPDTVFSVPFFERVLADLVADRKGVPAIFAAAGNRAALGDMPRVRFGYPAIRLETMAASFVAPDPTGEEWAEVVASVDVPATSGLKPCFAIDVNEMAVSRSDGSSFASAWLSGYYTALVSTAEATSPLVKDLGLLSKVAWLMQYTTRRRVPSGRHRLPSFVAVIRNEKTCSRSTGETDEFVSALSQEFRADFCLHGSTAMIGEWLRLNGRRFADINALVRKDLGDIDLVYSGKPDTAEAAKAFAREWVKQRLGRSWMTHHKRNIELHSYEGFVNAGERLRSVTPAIKIYVTRGGVIDTWGGLEDLERREIRFLPLTDPRFWARNKLYGSGADCLALNILHWISSVALLRLVSHGIGVEGPVAAASSLSEVTEILARAAAGETQPQLFGYERGDVRERLDRRFDRVETLMGSCARQGIFDESLEAILTKLRKLRQVAA